MAGAHPNTPPPVRRNLANCQVTSTEMIPYHEMEKFNIENLKLDSSVISEALSSISDDRVRFIHCKTNHGVDFILELDQFSYTTNESIVVEELPKVDPEEVPSVLRGAMNLTYTCFSGTMLVTADKIWVLRNNGSTITCQGYRITSGYTLNLQRDYHPYVIINQNQLTEDTMKLFHRLAQHICQSVFESSWNSFKNMYTMMRNTMEQLDKYKIYRQEFLNEWNVLFKTTPKEEINYQSVNAQREQLVRLQRDLSQFESTIADLYMKIKQLTQHIDN
jgi:hypothetical protein